MAEKISKSDDLGPNRAIKQQKNPLWSFAIDIRSAIGLPLHARDEYGLPSTRVQIDFSPSVNFKDSDPRLTKTTDMKYHT